VRQKRIFLQAVYLLRKHAADHWMRGGTHLPEDYALALPVILQQLAEKEGLLTGSYVNASAIAQQVIGQFDEQELAAKAHFAMMKSWYEDLFSKEEGTIG
jgi:hypothetical protein